MPDHRLGSDDEPDDVGMPRESRDRLTGQCRRCGYGLHDMSLDQACPECGVPVAWAAEPLRLQTRRPEYVRRLRMAALAVGVSLIVDPALWLATIALTRTMTIAAMSSWMTVVGPLSTLTRIVGLAGWWLLASRDPAMADLPAAVDPWSSLRRRLRGAVLLAGIASAALPLLVHVAGMGVGGPGSAIVMVLPGVARGVLLWFGLRYLARIADEIPRPRTAMVARAMGLVVPILLGVPPLVLVSLMLVDGSSTFVYTTPTGIAMAGLTIIARLGVFAVAAVAIAVAVGIRAAGPAVSSSP